MTRAFLFIGLMLAATAISACASRNNDAAYWGAVSKQIKETR